MNEDISVCGTECSKCYCFEAGMCSGCNACSGKVFHCADGEECSIYHCCVTEHGFKNCGECGKVPCGIWLSCRDPKYTDEQFADSIRERMAVLKGLAGK